MKKRKKVLTLSFICLIGLLFSGCNKSKNNQSVKSLKTDEIIVVAGGDVMLSRKVGEKINEAGNNSLPFLNIAEKFKSADLAFVNLESPFANHEFEENQPQKFVAQPESIEGLKFAGIDVVSLANNHFGDQGMDGMEFTFKHLKESGIGYFGAGENFSQAHRPTIFEIKAHKIAFLGYNGVGNGEFQATIDKPGYAYTKSETFKLEEDIVKAKEKADLVIVSLHHGAEYVNSPVEDQISISHAAIDAGADTVIGHHPHVTQPVEIYKNKPILYSLGNLIFDQTQSEAVKEGVIATYRFRDKRLDQIEFWGIIIENLSQPRFATPDEQKEILKRMDLNSNLIRF